jgi:SAM-dependent methyltransferase
LEASLEYTGERIIPDEPECRPGTPIYETHLNRYRFAAAYAAGKDVLDIACGVGYGSRYLLDHGAASVTGGDISPDAIEYAKRRYATSRTSFTVMSADDIPLSSSSMDCAVSMETIEHVPDAERFLAELRRVLRPGGTLLISTPNRATYGSGRDVPDNRFHTHEYNLEEFRALLGAHFEQVTVFAQRRLVRSSPAGKGLDALARRLRDRLGLRRLVPMRLRHLARTAADAYDPDSRVVPLQGGDEPLFYVAAAEVAQKPSG